MVNNQPVGDGPDVAGCSYRGCAPRDGCASAAESTAWRTTSPITTTTGVGFGGATTSAGHGAPSCPPDPEDPWSMVFLQMTDRRRLRCLSQALYVWHHDEPAAIFRHAAVQTRSHGLLGRAAGLHPAAPDAAAAGRRGAGCAGADRDHRDTGGRHGARRVPPAVPTPVWLSRARYRLDRSTVLCETSGTARVSGIDQRRGHRLRRHWCIRVSLWLNGFRRCCGGRSSTWRTRCPTATAWWSTELGPMVVELDVDGEVFSLRGGRSASRCRTVRRRWPVPGSPPRESPSSIVLDARVGLGEAVETGTVSVQGSLDDVQRAHDTLLAYVHAAVRAPRSPDCSSALRAGTP